MENAVFLCFVRRGCASSQAVLDVFLSDHDVCTLCIDDDRDRFEGCCAEAGVPPCRIIGNELYVTAPQVFRYSDQPATSGYRAIRYIGGLDAVRSFMADTGRAHHALPPTHTGAPGDSPEWSSRDRVLFFLDGTARARRETFRLRSPPPPPLSDTDGEWETLSMPDEV